MRVFRADDGDSSSWSCGYPWEEKVYTPDQEGESDTDQTLKASIQYRPFRGSPGLRLVRRGLPPRRPRNPNVTHDEVPRVLRVGLHEFVRGRLEIHARRRAPRHQRRRLPHRLGQLPDRALRPVDGAVQLPPQRRGGDGDRHGVGHGRAAQRELCSSPADWPGTMPNWSATSRRSRASRASSTPKRADDSRTRPNGQPHSDSATTAPSPPARTSTVSSTGRVTDERWNLLARQSEQPPGRHGCVLAGPPARGRRLSGTARGAWKPI